ncbi:hypothetical protein FA15DRAFT_29656 [Coprinopsis marcescibilis]|uniref:Uncharacterized protein n=1 Tax=Coprinopsis marcescibilis TaxID=230819 RepID=A0A5C3LDB6_COPMA|nr:hypothetical protein FA15DRAFT_29656 [Coprinopsis marcescibilis]
MAALQRSQSAPQPLSTLAPLNGENSQQKPLLRTVSHQHMHKTRTESYLKPLVFGGSRALPTSPLSPDQEDPFNLQAFYPPLWRGEGWQWLREETVTEEDEEEAEVEAEDAGGSPAIFVPSEDKATSEVIKGEDKLGILSIGNQYSMEDEGLMSPYKFEDAVDEDSLYRIHCDRRGMAVRGSLMDGFAGFGPVFFGSRS